MKILILFIVLLSRDIDNQPLQIQPLQKTTSDTWLDKWTRSISPRDREAWERWESANGYRILQEYRRYEKPLSPIPPWRIRQLREYQPFTP